jgi:hypothetical protein
MLSQHHKYKQTTHHILSSTGAESQCCQETFHAARVCGWETSRKFSCQTRGQHSQQATNTTTQQPQQASHKTDGKCNHLPSNSAAEVTEEKVQTYSAKT